MFVPLYDSILAGSQATEVAALFDDSALVRLGLADAGVLRDMVKRYQAAPEYFSTQSISILVALELQCRDILTASAGNKSCRSLEPAPHMANS